MKNSLTVVFLIFLALPFILMNDIYPFFRFGMFAEPINNVEFFELLEKTDDQPFRAVNRKDNGLSREQINYIVRHRFYDDSAAGIIKELVSKETKNKKYRLIRISFDASSGISDTIIIESIY